MVAVLYQPFPMAAGTRAQIWRYAPEYRRPRHVHSEPELNLVTRGSGTFGVGEATLAASAGDLLFWLPGQDHELLEASPSFDLFVVGLTPELSSRVLGRSTGSVYGGPVVARLGEGALARLGDLCQHAPGPSDSTSLEGHVGRLWSEAHASRATVRAPSESKHPLTRRALASLLDGAEAARSEMATRAGTHPSEVSRQFRKNMGVTLTAYRTRVRLLRFVEYVDDAAHTLLSASFAAGFGSYSQCHRAFSATFGCTPSDFFRRGVGDDMRDRFSPPGAPSRGPGRGARGDRCPALLLPLDSTSAIGR